MAQYKHPDEEDRWWNEKALAKGLLTDTADVVGTAAALPFRTSQEVGGGLLGLLEGAASGLTLDSEFPFVGYSGEEFSRGMVRGGDRWQKGTDMLSTEKHGGKIGGETQGLVHKGFEYADLPFQMFSEGIESGALMLGASAGTADWAKDIAYWTTSLAGPKGIHNAAKMAKVPVAELARHLKIYRDGWYTSKAGRPLQVGFAMPTEAAMSRTVAAWSPYYAALTEAGLTPTASASIARATANIEKTGKVSSSDARIIYNEVANQYGQLLLSGKPIPQHLQAAARLVFPGQAKVAVAADGSIPNMSAALSNTGFDISPEIADLITPVMRGEYNWTPGTEVNLLNKIESTASTGRMMSGSLSRSGLSKRVDLDGTNPNYKWMEDDLVNPDWPSYKTKGSEKSHKAKLQESSFHAMEAAWDSLMTKRSKWGRYGQYGRGYRFTADDFIDEIKNVNRKIADDYTADLAKWKEAGGAYNRKKVPRPQEPVFFSTPSKGDGVTNIADNVVNVKNADGSYTSSGHVRFGSTAKTGDYLLGTVRQTHILNPETGRMFNLAHDQLDLGSGWQGLENVLRSKMPGGRVVSLTGSNMSFSDKVLSKHNLYSKKSKGDPESSSFHHEELEMLGEGIAPGKGRYGPKEEESVKQMLALLFPLQQTSAKARHYLTAADKILRRGASGHVQAEKERERKNNRMRN